MTQRRHMIWLMVSIMGILVYWPINEFFLLDNFHITGNVIGRVNEYCNWEHQFKYQVVTSFILWKHSIHLSWCKFLFVSDALISWNTNYQTHFSLFFFSLTMITTELNFLIIALTLGLTESVGKALTMLQSFFFYE